MGDFVDDAQAVNELHQDVSLRNKLAEIRAVPKEFDGKHCGECGELIEPARLALRLYRCLDCARALEVYRRTHA